MLCGCRFDSVVKPCWEEDSAARPEFNAICATIEHFRRSSVGEDYYTAVQSDSEETYTNYAEDAFRY